MEPQIDVLGVTGSEILKQNYPIMYLAYSINIDSSGIQFQDYPERGLCLIIIEQNKLPLRESDDEEEDESIPSNMFGNLFSSLYADTIC